MTPESDNEPSAAATSSTPTNAHAAEQPPPLSQSQAQPLSTTTYPAQPSLPSSSSAAAAVEELNPCLLCLSFIFVLLISLSILKSTNVLLTLVYVFLGILPAFLMIHLTFRYLRDDSLSLAFKINQFMCSAVPITFLVFIVELFLSLFFVIVILGNDLKKVTEAFQEEQQQQQQTEDQQKDPSSVLSSLIPLWKLIILALVTAFCIAAFIEESAKWFVTRRIFKQYPPQSLSARGILASAVMSALGLATVENIAYILGLVTPHHRRSQVLSSSNIIWFVLLRDALAFPVHVGATMCIALAAAQKQLDGGVGGRAMFFKMYAVAVGFHGWFDGISLVAAALVRKKILPIWIDFVVVGVQVVSVVLFVVFLRVRVKALLERERAIGSHEVIDATTVVGNDDGGEEERV